MKVRAVRPHTPGWNPSQGGTCQSLPSLACLTPEVRSVVLPPSPQKEVPAGFRQEHHEAVRSLYDKLHHGPQHSPVNLSREQAFWLLDFAGVALLLSGWKDEP